MTLDIAIVFAITVLAILLFISERVRVDLVALLVMGWTWLPCWSWSVWP